MEEVDKGCLMIRMGVSGWMFHLVPAHLGSPGQRAVKQLCVWCHGSRQCMLLPSICSSAEWPLVRENRKNFVGKLSIAYFTFGIHRCFVGCYGLCDAYFEGFFFLLSHFSHFLQWHLLCISSNVKNMCLGRSEKSAWSWWPSMPGLLFHRPHVWQCLKATLDAVAHPKQSVLQFILFQSRLQWLFGILCWLQRKVVFSTQHLVQHDLTIYIRP